MWPEGAKLVCITSGQWWDKDDDTPGVGPEQDKIYTCRSCETYKGKNYVEFYEFPNNFYRTKHFVPVQDYSCTRKLTNDFVLVKESIDHPLIKQPTS